MRNAFGFSDRVIIDYTCGGCGVLAMELHKRTGWQIWSMPEYEHLYVWHPRGGPLDVTGFIDAGPEDWNIKPSRVEELFRRAIVGTPRDYFERQTRETVDRILEKVQ